MREADKQYKQFMADEVVGDFLFGREVTDTSVFSEKKGYGFREEEYREPAGGWQEGVYYPRKLTKDEPGAGYVTNGEGYLAIGSRVWTETESTGFGVYTYENTAVFSVKAAPGDYQVEVTFVNPGANAYKAYIKAEDIIKVNNITVKPGAEVTQSFTAVLVDGILDLKFLVQSGAVSEKETQIQYAYVSEVKITGLAPRQKRTKPAIYLASDSTVQSYEEIYAPQTGWGQVFSLFFGEQTGERACADCAYEQAKVYETTKVIVENRAIGGRSSKSFLLEGKLDDLLEDIRPGDYMLIQWGHNDATPIRPNRYVSPEDFAYWIQYYVDGARQRGAHPVLVTPVARYNFLQKADGTLECFQSDFEGYRQVMLKMAGEQNLALIDLTKRSIALCEQAGIEGAKHFFMQVKPGEYPDSVYKDGKEDATHLQYYGAYHFAKCVAQGILESDADCLKELKSLVEIPDAMPAETFRGTDASRSVDASQSVDASRNSEAFRSTDVSSNTDAPSGFLCYEIDRDDHTGKASFLVAFRGIRTAAAYRIYGKKISEKEYTCVKEFSAEEYKKDELGCCSMVCDAGHIYSFYITGVNREGQESPRSNVTELDLQGNITIKTEK